MNVATNCSELQSGIRSLKKSRQGIPAFYSFIFVNFKVSNNAAVLSSYDIIDGVFNEKQRTLLASITMKLYHWEGGYIVI